MLFKINTSIKPCASSDITEARKYKARIHEGIGWGVLGIMALLASTFIVNKVRADDTIETIYEATVNEVAAHEASAGQLLFEASGKFASAHHLHTDVNAKINGLTAKVQYLQKFRNDSSEWQQAVYVFPLPDNAAVYDLELIIGERVIKGEIQEKTRARRTYTAAVRAGKKAALLEQQRQNLFTQKVANIAPGEEISVAITYLHKLDFDNGRFEWRLPTTLTPRYIPGSPVPEEEPGQLALNPFGWAVATDQVRDADKITPFMVQAAKHENAMHLELELDAGLPLADIQALYHDIDVQKQAGKHLVRFLQKDVPMDRDVVLQWRPVASQIPSAAVFKETVSGHENADIDGDYLMLMVLPPSPSEIANAVNTPRDMVFVIDTSGSMQGPSIVQAKKSLSLALERLQPNDRFNVIEFNSNYSSVFSSLTFVDTSTVDTARRWVGGLSANNGTEMLPALSAGLHQFNEDSQRVQQLVFITDGAVGNEQALFKEIHKNLGGTRFFTVAIGSAPNSYFMKKAAQIGRGSFTHIGDISEVGNRMSGLFQKLEGVVAHDIHVSWPVDVEMYPEKIPDLYTGEPLLVTVKSAASAGEVVVEGMAANKPWQRRISLDIPANSSSGIATLWARDKVASLEDEKIRGRSPEEVRQAVLPLALGHRLVTAYTSYVAVEKTPSRPADAPLESSAVPNLVAHGQTVSTVVYPRTASSMLLNLWLGLMSVLGLLFVRMWGRS